MDECIAVAQRASMDNKNSLPQMGIDPMPLAFKASEIEPVPLAFEASVTTAAPVVLHYTNGGTQM